MFRLNVETLVFTADDLITRTFNVSDLENVYGSNIYKAIIGEKTYFIDLARSFARLDNTQNIQFTMSMKLLYRMLEMLK